MHRLILLRLNTILRLPGNRQRVVAGSRAIRDNVLHGDRWVRAAVVRRQRWQQRRAALDGVIAAATYRRRN